MYVATVYYKYRHDITRCQTGLMNSGESTEIWSIQIRPQGSCRVRNSKFSFLFSYERARIRFIDFVPHHHGIPQQILPLVFFKDPDQPMTDAKFEELACFNCMSPGAILLFPSINSAIQAYNGSTEFGSIRPLLSSSRRSKLNKEAQKQRSHTVIHEVGFGSLKKGRIFHHDINIRDSRFCAKFFTVTRQ